MTLLKLELPRCANPCSQLPVSTPDGLSASGGNQIVSLNWNSSTGSPPVSYHIYRSSETFSDEFIVNDNHNYI